MKMRDLKERIPNANRIYPWPLHTERDSRKDEAVVFIFIFATAGLLGWAAVKPWVGKWVEVNYANSSRIFVLNLPPCSLPPPSCPQRVLSTSFFMKEGYQIM